MEMLFKSITSGVEIKDADQGLVQAVVARVGIPDADGDLFLPGAFGEQKVRVSAYSHKSWPHKGGEMPVGRGVIREVGDEVIADLQFFMDTASGREHFATVKGLGELGEWSFGFIPARATVTNVPDEFKDSARTAYSWVPVVEVTPTMLGASVGTRTVAVKSSEEAETPEPEAEPEPVPVVEAPSPEAELKEAIALEVARFEAIKIAARL